MLDTQISVLLQGYIRDLLPAYNGYPVGIVGVQANMQYRQAGRPDGASVFIHQIGRVRVGWLARANTVNMDPDTGLPISVTRTQKQRMRSSFQISALVPQSPAITNCETLPPSESDVLDAVAQTLQSTAVLDSLTANGLAVERITEIRSMWVTGDDREQNVNNPSFDIIIVHNSVFSTTVPLIDSITLKIDRV